MKILGRQLLFGQGINKQTESRVMFCIVIK